MILLRLFAYCLNKKKYIQLENNNIKNRWSLYNRIYPKISDNSAL